MLYKHGSRNYYEPGSHPSLWLLTQAIPVLVALVNSILVNSLTLYLLNHFCKVEGLCLNFSVS